MSEPANRYTQLISDLVEAAHSQLGAVHRGPREAVVYRGPREAGPVRRGPQGAGPVRRGLRGVGHSRNLGVEAGSRRVGEVELRMGHTAGSLGEGRGNKKCVRHNYVAAVLTASATEREDVCVCLCPAFHVRRCHKTHKTR